MNGFLDQLNLTPQERRIVVVIAVVVFVVLNLLLVWPHFKDLARVRQDLDQTRETMSTWKKEILQDTDATTNGLKNQLKALERQQGGGIVNQQVQLQKSISDQAIKTGVNISDTRPATTSHPETNDFYEEQAVKITFESQEEQLVNFLFNVGNDPAMIRVRELSLKTADANRYRLRGDALLSANYAKRPAAATGKTAAPAGKKPGAAPSSKPAPGDKTLPGPKSSPNPNKLPGAQPARKNL
jgi:Tfp pilus assembly protein PilO